MAIKKTNKRVVITLTAEEFEQLNKLTELEQRSKTNVLKSALSLYFKKSKKSTKGTS
jgi:PHD/YefM family antitoxin component YafN of YafNO toxin-antitoxin module